ncbi:MAG: UDP-N-acetylmuramoyl-L-alanyl-D-glutamate--2,6-diaminopimelate ligase [Rhodocyclaceae bacterium]|nr:UDP-N-acetylmuramoyl-L-alanyl-D-glutamate--2,6-diaminopimelate ligase [Rhodocyclaceae bacterium]MBX3670186.1 UDP-N-acetylmuramoyl-L-alanyl-D-glutamate--2,6-diaminopimelate ligase [Rhodocyclaceae bacterium]
MQILDELRRQGVAVTALCADSRRVQAGEVFVATVGANSDARLFMADAAERGAAALLYEAQGWHWDASLRLPNLGVTKLTPLLGDIANQVYGRPSDHLFMVGVTGTNGKTSVSQWCAAALAACGRPCAVIGTLGIGFPGALVPSANTTPDAIAMHSALRDFLAAGACACAMEVSSIGLAQNRVAGVSFDVAVFTNLSRDHLDYHGNMDSYAAAKTRLFAWPGLGAAVINLDDALAPALVETARAQGARITGYSLDAGRAAQFAVDDLVFADALDEAGGLAFDLHAAGQRVRVVAPLVGRFNVSNLLAVTGVLLYAGAGLDAIAAALANLRAPLGRMQCLGGEAEPLVVVDYAHTPDALDKTLQSLRRTASARGGRLVCVFGCGGERDAGKRPLMGEIAARLADRVLITSDNPRSENPLDIIQQIARGAPAAEICPDRAAAIRQAIATAAPQDVILLAGKGHEPYQEIAGVRHAFSDYDVAQTLLQESRQ